MTRLIDAEPTPVVHRITSFSNTRESNVLTGDLEGTLGIGCGFPPRILIEDHSGEIITFNEDDDDPDSNQYDCQAYKTDSDFRVQKLVIHWI